MTKSLLRIFISHPWSITVVLLETGADSKKSKNMSIFKFKSRWPQDKVGKTIERFWNWCQPRIRRSVIPNYITSCVIVYVRCYIASKKACIPVVFHMRWYACLIIGDWLCYLFFSYQIVEEMFCNQNCCLYWRFKSIRFTQWSRFGSQTIIANVQYGHNHTVWFRSLCRFLVLNGNLN